MPARTVPTARLRPPKRVRPRAQFFGGHALPSANGWYAEDMAESAIPNTGDPRVDAALDRIRGKFSDLEDAMLVQAHLEKGMAERLKEHAQFLADQQAAMQLHTQKMSEFDDKLNALIDIVGKMQGGMETRPS